MHLLSCSQFPWWRASPEGTRFDSQVHLSTPHWSWWCGWKSTRDGWSQSECESTFTLIQLETALHWRSLCRPLLRSFQKNTPQKLSTDRQSFHPCLSWTSKTKVRSQRSFIRWDWWERSNYEAWSPRIRNTSRTALNSVTVSCIGEVRMMYRSRFSWCCQKGYDRRSQWHGSSVDIKHPQSCMDPVLLALNCSWCRGQSQDLRLCLAENLTGFWVTSVSKYV